jgi:hypothetical protein
MTGCFGSTKQTTLPTTSHCNNDFPGAYPGSRYGRPLRRYDLLFYQRASMAEPLQCTNIVHLTGCGGKCTSTSACSFVRKLQHEACNKGHCVACLMPLKRQSGINMHPSGLGWKNCTFKYRDCVRKYLVLAALGEKLQLGLPQGFPRTGPDDALVDWVFSSQTTSSPPNIVLFVASLIGLDSKT